MANQTTTQTKISKSEKIEVRLSHLENDLPSTKAHVSLKPLRSFRRQRSLRPSAIMPSSVLKKSEK